MRSLHREIQVGCMDFVTEHEPNGKLEDLYVTASGNAFLESLGGKFGRKSVTT